MLGGGAGADIFVFTPVSHSRPGAADRIVASDGIAAMEGVGNAGGDLIDLSAIDANTAVAGDQAFVFGTYKSFLTTAGRLWVEDSGTNTVVRGTVDTKAGVDFEIIIDDGALRSSAYRRSTSFSDESHAWTPTVPPTEPVGARLD